MPLPIGHIIGILSDNLRIRKSVMPLSRKKATGWAKGLDLPMGGETVLFTGHMYQLMPSIASMSHQMASFEDSWITKTMGLGRFVNRFINTSRFMARANAQDQADFDKRLRNIALLLKQAKVQFGYLYTKEMYAGALIHDQGCDAVFTKHARRVYDVLKKHGVRRVITVDPHTTNMLRTVYPKLIPGFDLEVKSYVEVLAEKALKPAKTLGDTPTVLHDSCVYARYENVVDEPRRLLKQAGVDVRDADASGKLTQCCGGPIESLFPQKAKGLAETRLAQLKETGSSCVLAMCPICLLALQNAAKGNGLQVKDLSEYLAEAYCVPQG